MVSHGILRDARIVLMTTNCQSHREWDAMWITYCILNPRKPNVLIS